MECKYCDDFTGVCTNGECPMCADACPVPDTEGICKFEQREERIYKLTPKGCVSLAMMDAGLIGNGDDPRLEVFWTQFLKLMVIFGYAPEDEEEQCQT